MAVRMMTRKEDADKPNVETVRDYPGHQEGWHHGKDCPHRGKVTPEKTPECVDRIDYSCDECRHFDPLYMETTYVGCVLQTYEQNGYDDSDFCAIVWDEESQAIKHITYASTRGWTYPNGASVDATPEVIEKAKAVVKTEILRLMKLRNESEAKRAKLDRQVRVVKGRKVPIGTTGEVGWIGPDKFARVPQFGRAKQRVGIRDLTGKIHYTSEDNVEVVNPEQYLQSDEELEQSYRFQGWRWSSVSWLS
jgi:hypothetical protein